MEKTTLEIWKDRKRIIELGPEKYLELDTYPASWVRQSPEGTWMRQYVKMAAVLGEALPDPPMKEIWELEKRKASDYFEGMAFCYNDTRTRPVAYHAPEGYRHLSTAYELAMFRHQVDEEIFRTPSWNTYVTLVARPKDWLRILVDTHYGSGDNWSLSLGWKHPAFGQLLVAQATRIIGSLWVGFIDEWDLEVQANEDIRAQARK